MHPGKLNTAILFFLWFTGLTGQVPTYNEAIRPILDRHCAGCHRPGQSGAMPLTNYEEVAAYGRMIGYVTTHKLMPPWYADPNYNHFANERILSDSEINTIQNWIEGNMPLGADSLSEKISNSVDSVFAHRKPDLEISMAQGFEQYGIYLDQYQVFVLPVSLTEGKWIEGIEFVPGNRKIVRFASISMSDSPAFDSLDQWDPRYGYYRFGGLGYPAEEPYWYTWSPLQKPTFLPQGVAKYLPANSKLIVAIHYGPTGKPQTDSSSIRLYFASGPPMVRHTTAPFINPYSVEADSFFIPAGIKKAVHGTFETPFDIEITSLTPQANLLCKSWEIWALVPGQTDAIKLLKLTDWNFNWKTTYHLRQPMLLPKGTKLHARAVYDNTIDNPCNPAETPVPFRSGSNLFNELFYVHFGYTTHIPENPRVILYAPAVICSPSISFEIMLQNKEALVIQLMDHRSREEINRVENLFKKGKHTVELKTTALSNGPYVLRVTTIKGVILAEQLVIKVDKGDM
jgi:hypothetical protein